MACVSKRRGKWVADFRDATGRRHWQSYETKREAEAALHRQAVQIESGKFIADGNHTVGEAYAHYLELHVEGSQNRSRKPLRATTQALYAMTWRVHVAPKWAHQKLKHVYTDNVAIWQHELEQSGLGAKTVINCMALLAAVFKHARLMRWTVADPTDGISRPTYRFKVKAFTREQILAITAKAEDSGDHETALIVRMLAVTGLRIGELIGLQWQDVDLAAGLLYVRRQFTHGAWADLKTENAQRSIPLPAALVRLLETRKGEIDGSVARLPAGDDRLVFPAANGQPLDYRNWTRRKFDPVLKAAGVEGTPHMLRHAYATALIQSGESAPTVAALIGHSKPSFTMNVYADAWPAAVSGAGEKVQGLLFGSSGSKVVAPPRARTRKAVQVIEKFGGPCAIRTRDQLVKRKP